MTIPPAGTLLYRVSNSTDAYGFVWTYIDRAEVTATGPDIRTSVIETATFPDHTPPEDWPSLEWEHPPGAEALILNPGSIGGMWKTKQPTLPASGVTLPDDIEQRYLAYTGDRVVGDNSPLTATATAEELALFSVHAYRVGRRAWRS